MTSTGAPYGPLSLLAASLAPVIGAPAIESTRHGLFAVGALVAVTPLVVRDWRSTLRRLGFGLIAAGSVGVSSWLYGGRDLDESLGALLRIVYLILPAAVLTPFIEPNSLGDHLGQRLRLPARAVTAATAALQRLESMGRQWEQIGRARRARGVGPDGSPLNRTRVSASMCLALLVATLRMSGSMSLAMDARGFATARRRTWAEAAPWQPRDTVVLVGGLACAALPWVLLLPMTGPVVALG